MAYAFYGQDGYLHVVDHLGVAVESCVGIVVETDIPNHGGYPFIDGKRIIFDTKTAKSSYIDDNGLTQSIETPQEVEQLIEKIFMNEYEFSKEGSLPPLP